MESRTVTCPYCRHSFDANAAHEKITCNFCGETFSAPQPAESPLSDTENADYYLRQAVSDLGPAVCLGFDPAVIFSKGSYAQAFDAYYERISGALLNLDRAYNFCSGDKNALLGYFAEAFEETVKQSAGTEDFNALKGSQMDRVVYLYVTFAIPSILRFNKVYADTLADLFVESWNRAHKKRKIAKTTYEEIDNGFKKRLCFITTAACTALGRTDDCYELGAFRRFRDEYLCCQPGGKEQTQEYYLIAPIIVNAINASKDRQAVYRGIWTNHLSKCLALYERQDYAGCRDEYAKCSTVCAMTGFNCRLMI